MRVPLLAIAGAVAALGLTTLRPPLGARPPIPALRSRADTGAPAPELTNDSWLNTEHPLTVAELRGRVVLLNFWVFTCVNCTRSLPSLIDFDDQYRAQGLTIIGIHTPEFPPYSGEHDRENVRRALRAFGIRYAVAQDNDRRTWDAYGIRYWPSFVLIDRRGRIRYEGYGEFHEHDDTYNQWTGRIEALLAEQAPAVHLEQTPGASGTRLTLVADRGVRINARLKPALELESGTVLRFDSPHVTADSAYFTDGPTALAPAGVSLHHTVLRASVCPTGERYCRELSIPVDR